MIMNYIYIAHFSYGYVQVRLMYNTKRNATFPNSDVLNKMSLNCEGRLNKSPQGYTR
jgi:hypothetical protein